MGADCDGTDNPLGSFAVPVMVTTVVRVPAVRLVYTAQMGLESVVLCGDGKICFIDLSCVLCLVGAGMVETGFPVAFAKFKFYDFVDSIPNVCETFTVR